MPFVDKGRLCSGYRIISIKLLTLLLFFYRFENSSNLFTHVYPGNPVLDAWYGARKWARTLSNNLRTVSVTREEYDEKGGEYLKENFASNLYVPTPSQS